MGFLDSIKSIFTGSASDDAAYWVYVRCRRCGEVLRTRLDLRNNLTEQDEGGFIARKTLVGSGLCFERIEVTLFFDPNRHLVDREIARGEFITAEAYEAAQSGSTAAN